MTRTAQRSSELARARGLAERSDLPWIDLDAELVDPSAAKALSLDVMADALAIPYAFEGRTLKVALADPRTRTIAYWSSTISRTSSWPPFPMSCGRR